MKVNFSKIEQLAEEQGISLNALAIKMGKNTKVLEFQPQHQSFQ